MASVCPPCPELPISQLLDLYMANLLVDNNVNRLRAQTGAVSAFFRLQLQGNDYIRYSASTLDADGTNAINTRMAKQVSVGTPSVLVPNPIYVAMRKGEPIKIIGSSPVLGTTYKGLYYKPFVVDWVQPDGSIDSSKLVIREVVGLGILA